MEQQDKFSLQKSQITKFKFQQSKDSKKSSPVQSVF